jgi:hypothetical protein
VIAMRFDCNEIGNIMSEVAAYGTAVTIRPLAGHRQVYGSEDSFAPPA